MGFKVSKASPCIWIRADRELYEYIAVYVDDLAIAAKNAKEIIRCLKEKHGFKIKGDGPLDYHLGMQFGRDPDGTLFQSSNKYVSKILKNYERVFGEQPREYTSPLEKNDHPEIDDTPEIEDQEKISLYMSMIGELQW